jgi:hypothetical protein
MPKAEKKLAPDSTVLVSASELAEIIGADFETVNNWVRRGIISRVPIGGRQLRARLFPTEQVYKAAITNELVKLGIQPSPAMEATNQVWEAWEKKPVSEGQKVYAVMVQNKDEWTVELVSRKVSGGLLYRWGRTGGKSAEVELPKQAFAVIPISDVLERASNKLSKLVSLKAH